MSSAYKFTECDLEIAILDHLEKNLGYIYSSADSFHRTEKDALLKDDFCNYLRKRYPDASLTDSEMASIIARLEYIPSSPLYTGSRDTFWLINEGIDFLREDKSGKSIHIDYIDFENIDNNVFRVVNQYKFKPHDQRRIPDILIFINGIPVAIFELKSVSDERVTVHNAWEQITIRYTRDIPELLNLYNEHCFTEGGFIAPMALSSYPEEKKPSACIGCRSCEAVCPQQIKISEAMADFAEKLGM